MKPRDIFIVGVGVVSPVGCDSTALVQAFAGKKEKHLRELKCVGSNTYKCASPPDFDVDKIISASRLRRVSPISQFACAAATLALRDAKLSLDDKAIMRRVGVVTAVAQGGMTVTRQFQTELVRQGVRAVSPMLFPETVYNAPSSHLAAVLGCDHVNYTIVGDAAAAFNAVAMACDLLESGGVDQCLVVGAEEADWVTADAYHRFNKKVVTGEGAGALLLAKGQSGYARVIEVDRGQPFHSRAERNALAAGARDVVAAQLGEAFTAGAIWQLIADALRVRQERKQVRSLCVGLNEQASTITLGPV